MPADLQTSFIPKSPITTRAPERRSGIGVVTLTSIVLLLVVGVAYGALFAYELWLTKEIGKPDDSCTTEDTGKCSLQASIKRIEETVRRELITEIKQTGERIALAETLLAGRTQMTGVFTALEGLTLSSVQITDFSYKIGEPLKLKGLARGYEPVALQSDALTTARTENKGVVAYHISDLTLNKNGDVAFSLSLTLAPSVLHGVQTDVSTEESSSTPPTL